LEADSKKPVRKWNLSEIYGIEIRSSGEIAAVGASIKFHDQKTTDIDFTKGKRLSAYEFNASLMAWKITAVVVAIFLFLILKGYWGVYSTTREHKKVQSAQKTTIEDFRGLSGTEIQSNLDKIKSQNNNLQNLTRDTHLITPLLVEIVETIPAEIWITKMNYSDEFPSKGAEARSLTLEGLIKSESGDGRADLALGNQFKDALGQQPIARQICGSQIAIQYGNIAGTGGGPKRGQAEQATRFTLTCARSNSGSKGGRQL